VTKSFHLSAFNAGRGDVRKLHELDVRKSRGLRGSAMQLKAGG